MPFFAHPARATIDVTAANVTRRSLFILHQHFLGTLLEDVELDAAIRFASLIGLVVGDRPIRPEALGLHARGLDAFARQILRDRFGALLRQLAVDLGRAG